MQQEVRTRRMEGFALGSFTTNCTTMIFLLGQTLCTLRILQQTVHINLTVMHRAWSSDWLEKRTSPGNTGNKGNTTAQL